MNVQLNIHVCAKDLTCDVGRHLLADAFIHPVKSQNDKGDGEYLPHVQEHTFLEGFLILLRVFDEDTTREDEEQAESEEEAAAHLLRVTTVEEPMNAKEDGVANGLVELSWVARNQIDTFEDERPRQVRRSSNDFGVHQITQSYGTRTNGCDDGNVVENM